MTKDQLKGKKIAVFGLAVEGEASARFLLKYGAVVTVFDQKIAQDIDQQLIQELKQAGAAFIFGPDAFSHWQGMDVIIRTPGIRRSLPEILAAEKAGVVITSQTQLFFDFCVAKIIGVTGTKGKGTTSTLIYRMLKAAGQDTYLGGNIGKPPFTFLDQLSPDSKVVLELSSFQLEDLTKSPHIAVMLMVTSEHLGTSTNGAGNYHDSLEDYISAKRNIVRFQTEQDITILNRDYSATADSQAFTQGRVYFVSQNTIEQSDGCFVRERAIWLRLKGREEKIIDTNKVLLPGKHNLENICAASLAASLSGVSTDVIRETLSTFQGLEHRLELAGEVNGVKYYDDSFSTTPETAVAAIQAFTAPKVLILGGSHKASDFTELAHTIEDAKNIRCIIGIGDEWSRIKEALANFPNAKHIPVIEGLKDMPSIVKVAKGAAQSGDVVLLSPACASFGLFPNYKVRGDQFKAEVKKLQTLK